MSQQVVEVAPKTVAELEREVDIAEGYQRIAAVFARIHRGTATGAKLEVALFSAQQSTTAAREALRMALEVGSDGR